ncbi:MAG: sugar ABC transporter ATP-binding protein [Actinomycetales bacterium]|uniref:Sugar ABC transporter ATP-binding protein n=1 Tax=Candidatus Phosphoribacter hodrii TaxID=2953743 RepID=A0A934X3D8_9MICO|nr:sugar ABC transporter ATP-binding protein [Candidatus Phosphoribacter hodrii]
MTPASAIAAGVQVIYQDFSLFPNLSVAENIAMPRQRAVGGRFYSARAARPIAQGIVDELGLALDLDADVAALSVADKQLTAICRALVNDAQIIIMDEPTTALTGAEVTALFAPRSPVAVRGVSLIFVSHKLDEVLRVSQRLTVLRNGTWVATGAAGDYDRDAIAGLMTGKGTSTLRGWCLPSRPTPPSPWKVKGLGRPGAFADVDLVVRCGEIVGLTGLLGSGRGEIAEAIFGVRPATTGTISVGGHPVRIQSIPDAVAAGIGYVPEDRLTQGLFLDDSIADNVVAALGHRICRSGQAAGPGADARLHPECREPATHQGAQPQPRGFAASRAGTPNVSCSPSG